MLTIEDKKYINGVIRKSHKSFQNDSKRYLGILMEQNKHEFKLIRELMVVRPTKEEVDEKIQEHVSVYHTIS